MILELFQNLKRGQSKSKKIYVMLFNFSYTFRWMTYTDVFKLKFVRYYYFYQLYVNITSSYQFLSGTKKILLMHGDKYGVRN